LTGLLRAAAAEPARSSSRRHYRDRHRFLPVAGTGSRGTTVVGPRFTYGLSSTVKSRKAPRRKGG
jgi:hypothetical protein